MSKLEHKKLPRRMRDNVARINEFYGVQPKRGLDNLRAVMILDPDEYELCELESLVGYLAPIGGTKINPYEEEMLDCRLADIATALQALTELRDILCNEYDGLEADVFEEMGVTDNDVDAFSELYQKAREEISDRQDARWDELEEEHRPRSIKET